MPGNSPQFDRYDSARTFMALQGKKSRSALSNEMSIGEGTMRALLDCLKQKKLVESNRPGHMLTANGKKLHKQMNELLEHQTIRNILGGTYTLAFLLKTRRNNDASVELRDIAVRMGARAALVLGYDGKLTGKGMKHLDTKPLEVLFDYRKGNTIIIISAYNKATAERAGIAACEAVSQKLRSTINKLC